MLQTVSLLICGLAIFPANVFKARSVFLKLLSKSKFRKCSTRLCLSSRFLSSREPHDCCFPLRIILLCPVRLKTISTRIAINEILSHPRATRRSVLYFSVLVQQVSFRRRRQGHGGKAYGGFLNENKLREAKKKKTNIFCVTEIHENVLCLGDPIEIKLKSY